MKTRFLLRFLLVFAILIPLAAATRLPRFYSSALAATATALSPALSGWTLRRDDAKDPPQLRFRRGAESLPFELSLDAMALGLLPLLSLIAATPGIRWRPRVAAALIGIAGLFLLHLAVVTAYPWMVRNPNAIKDISGTFLGLLTFVGGPVILWFALTYKSLRQVWRL